MKATKPIMTMNETILQLEASLKGARTLHKAGRCSLEEVERIERRLNEVRAVEQNNVPANNRISAEIPKENAVDSIDKEKAVVTGRRVDQDEYNSLQADWSKEADQLTRQMAELSNKLYLVPPAVACPELTDPILKLKAQVEAIWDKKRYLERNRCLPEDDEPRTTKAVEESQQKLATAQQKRRLIDERSKLRKKLENPKAKEAKRTVWESRLVQVGLLIDQLDDQLRVL